MPGVKLLHQESENKAELRDGPFLASRRHAC